MNTEWQCLCGQWVSGDAHIHAYKPSSDPTAPKTWSYERQPETPTRDAPSST